MALPLGAERDPFDIPEDGDGDGDGSKSKHVLFSTNQELFLLGVALTAVLLMLIILCLYCRLQSEHAALAKDKLSGFSMKELWSRFNNERRFSSKGKTYNKLRQTEMELSATPMLDDQLDSADIDDMHS